MTSQWPRLTATGSSGNFPSSNPCRSGMRRCKTMEGWSGALSAGDDMIGAEKWKTW